MLPFQTYNAHQAFKSFIRQQEWAMQNKSAENQFLGID